MKDIVELFCQFSKDLELHVNKPSIDFLVKRTEFLDEEVDEHKQALFDVDMVGIIDGAADTAFVALTQIYHAFRYAGFSHEDSVLKTKKTLQYVGEANLTKLPQERPNEKIKKPDNFVAPDGKIRELL